MVCCVCTARLPEVGSVHSVLPEGLFLYSNRRRIVSKQSNFFLLFFVLSTNHPTEDRFCAQSHLREKADLKKKCCYTDAERRKKEKLKVQTPHRTPADAEALGEKKKEKDSRIYLIEVLQKKEKRENGVGLKRGVIRTSCALFTLPHLATPEKIFFFSLKVASTGKTLFNTAHRICTSWA